MSTLRILTVLTLSTILAYSAVAELPTTAPAVTPIPPEKLAKLASLIEQPPGVKELSRTEAIRKISQRMDEAMTFGAELETDYPDAPGLNKVRMDMLKAAQFLVMVKPGDASAKQLFTVADRIISSDAPAMEKFQADLIKTFSQLTLKAPGANVNRADVIRKFVKRYEGTDAAAMAAVYGHSIAVRLAETDLTEELRKVLTTKHGTNPAAARYLNALAKSAVGKPFTASLTRLGGETLNLPDDLKGKVVVIDFWATWCGPCRAAMPEMKQIYAKYKDEGLEIVGISLDTDRAALDKYIAAEKLTWIHTYTGKGRQDPTANKYGVSGIPSIWVVGRDGKVASDQARGQLEAVIEGALILPAADSEKN